MYLLIFTLVITYKFITILIHMLLLYLIDWHTHATLSTKMNIYNFCGMIGSGAIRSLWSLKIPFSTRWTILHDLIFNTIEEWRPSRRKKILALWHWHGCCKIIRLVLENISQRIFLKMCSAHYYYIIYNKRCKMKQLYEYKLSCSLCPM